MIGSSGVPLIDRDEFEKGKRDAVAYWRGRGDLEAAGAFEHLSLGVCRFGLDARARLAWAGDATLKVGLRFDIESGAYVNSFIRRSPPPPPPPPPPAP